MAKRALVFALMELLLGCSRTGLHEATQGDADTPDVQAAVDAAPIPQPSGPACPVTLPGGLPRMLCAPDLLANIGSDGRVYRAGTGFLNGRRRRLQTGPEPIQGLAVGNGYFAMLRTNGTVDFRSLLYVSFGPSDQPVRSEIELLGAAGVAQLTFGSSPCALTGRSLYCWRRYSHVENVDAWSLDVVIENQSITELASAFGTIRMQNRDINAPEDGSSRDIWPTGCLLTTEREIWCWRARPRGHVVEHEVELVPFPSDVRPRTLVDSGVRVCALTEERSVYCWNLPKRTYELGTPLRSYLQSTQLFREPALEPACGIRAGGGSVCVLSPQGEIRCRLVRLDAFGVQFISDADRISVDQQGIAWLSPPNASAPADFCVGAETVCGIWDRRIYCAGLFTAGLLENAIPDLDYFRSTATLTLTTEDFEEEP